MAYGSLLELETQYLISIDLKYIKLNDTVKNLFRSNEKRIFRNFY